MRKPNCTKLLKNGKMGIKLTQGKWAIIDRESFEKIKGCKWCTDNPGGLFYACSSSPMQNGKRGPKILMHRIIMGAEKGTFIDHRDRDGLNNCLSNLRFCTQSDNQHNRIKPSGNYTSKLKGVSWFARDKKWQAGIKINSKSISLGRFNTQEEAAEAYKAGALKYHGEFART